MPVIPAENHFMVFAAIAVLMWLGFASEKTRLGKITTGIVWTGGLAILFSNIGLIPMQAPVYSFVKGYLVPLAIPLFLMKVNLREIFQETGKTMVAFIIGALATLAGTLLSLGVVNLGPLESELAGIFAATYIGGTLNFAASAEALQVQDDVLLSTALAADSIAGKSYLILLAALPAFAFMKRMFPETETGAVIHDTQPDPAKEPATLESMATALAVALVVCAAGYAVADMIDMRPFGILFVTAFALVPGTLFPVQTAKLHGSYELGIICAFLFFAAVGAGADVGTLVSVAPSIIVFAILIIVIHAAILFPVARLLGLGLAETITASNACILGPTTAAALAAAKGWQSQITPGLLTGVFGYSIGTFLGVMLANLV